MANIDKYTDENGRIILPYNFNSEKYIIGIEKKNSTSGTTGTTLMGSKTILPIKDAKPSNIIEITPVITNTFFYKKEISDFNIINNELTFKVNLLINDIPISLKDVKLKIDRNDKYYIKNTIKPDEIIIGVNNSASTITSGDTIYFHNLTNDGKFSEKINLFLEYNEIPFNTTLELFHEKSYFEVVSLYDSIDVHERSDNSADTVRKNVITIDGYFNDNKVNKGDLSLNLVKNGNTFTTLASTMGYINVEKDKNEWYLSYKESKEKGLLPDYVVTGDTNDIYDKKNNRLVISGKTLYHDKNTKIIDSTGNTNFDSVYHFDLSGNVYNSITSNMNTGGFYTVDLNGDQWVKATDINPDPNLYDVYQSNNENRDVHSTGYTMYIEIEGLETFSLRIRSWAESDYDYVMVSQLDETLQYNTSYLSSSVIKHTRGEQNSGTTFNDYIPVDFKGIDKTKKHTISIIYRKDGSKSENDDKGYVLIPKSNGSSGSGGSTKIVDSGRTVYYNGNKIIDGNGQILSGGTTVIFTSGNSFNYGPFTYELNNDTLLYGNDKKVLMPDMRDLNTTGDTVYKTINERLYYGSKDVLYYNSDKKIPINSSTVNYVKKEENGDVNVYCNNDPICKNGLFTKSGFTYNFNNKTVSDSNGNTIITSSKTINTIYNFYINNSGVCYYNYNTNTTMLSGSTLYNTSGEKCCFKKSNRFNFVLYGGHYLNKTIKTGNFFYIYTSGDTKLLEIYYKGSSNVPQITPYDNIKTSVTGDVTAYTYNGTTIIKYKKNEATISASTLQEVDFVFGINGLVYPLSKGVENREPLFKYNYSADTIQLDNKTIVSFNGDGLPTGDTRVISLNDNYKYVNASGGDGTVFYGTGTTYNDLKTKPGVIITGISFNSIIDEPKIVNGALKYGTTTLVDSAYTVNILSANTNYKYDIANDIIKSGTTTIKSGNTINTAISGVKFDLSTNTITGSGSIQIKVNGFDKEYSGIDSYTAISSSNEITINYDKVGEFNIENNSILQTITFNGGENHIFSYRKRNNAFYALQLTGTTENGVKSHFTINNSNITHDVFKNNTNLYTIKGALNNLPITALTITNIDENKNKKTYIWDKATSSITENDIVLTNNNSNYGERLFYYVKNNALYYNDTLIQYVYDDNDYYDLNTGKKVFIVVNDDGIKIRRNGKIIPNGKDLLDSFNNLKLDQNSSYDIANSVEKDTNNRVPTQITRNNNVTPYRLENVFKTTLYNDEKGILNNEYGVEAIGISGTTKDYHIEGGFILKNNNVKSGNTTVISSSGVINTGYIGVITKKNDGFYYRDKLMLTVSNGVYTGYYNGVAVNDSQELINYEDYYATVSPSKSDVPKELIIDAYPDNEVSYQVRVKFALGDEDGGIGSWTFTGNTGDKSFGTSDGNLTFKGYVIGDKNGNIYRRHDLISSFTKCEFVDFSSGTTEEYLNTNNSENDNEITSVIRDSVYYNSHNIDEIKKYIPDFISLVYKNYSNVPLILQTVVNYNGIASDEKEYSLIEGGYNNSSYKIKVEPQVITNSMISNKEKLRAYVVNNNGDQIPYNTYKTNGYELTYVTDGGSSATTVSGDTCIIELTSSRPIFNEIKFSLKCNGNTVNQEIVEVLGENKIITSTEYINNTDTGVTFTITERYNTYYNIGIVWGIEKGLDGVEKKAAYILNISSGVSGTVILSGTCNDIKVYEKAIVITKNGEKGETGQQGPQGATGPQGPQGATGPAGPRGKLLYPAGRWDSGTTYDGRDSEKTPFVTYKVGNEDKYFVLTAATIISGTSYEPTASGWTEMAQYEALYTKLLVAENGLVGGSVYNGDYVFSKHGISGDTISSTTISDKYENFKIDIVNDIFNSGKTSSETFIPNYLVDFKTGRGWYGAGKMQFNEKGVTTYNFYEKIEKDIYFTGTTKTIVHTLTNDDFQYDKIYIRRILSGATETAESLVGYALNIKVDGKVKKTSKLKEIEINICNIDNNYGIIPITHKSFTISIPSKHLNKAPRTVNINGNVITLKLQVNDGSVELKNYTNWS